MRAIIIVLLLMMFIGVFPVWPHSHEWGYYPSGGFGSVLVVIVVLMLLGII